MIVQGVRFAVRSVLGSALATCAAAACAAMMVFAAPVFGNQAVADEGGTAAPAQITASQQVELRWRVAETDVERVGLSNLTDEWAQAISSVTVEALNGNSEGKQTLRSDQYEIDAALSCIIFNRTASEPIFSIAVGEGEPLTISSFRGTVVYPQSKQYRITIKADGYSDCEGTVTFYTGGAGSFYVAVDDNGNGVVDEGEIRRTFSADELEGLAKFQNCSLRGDGATFRTFSAIGVPVATLIEAAGVTVSKTDTFKLGTPDSSPSFLSYDHVFGTRYFLQCAYNAPEVKAVCDQAGFSDIDVRRIVAEKAQEDGSVAPAMIALNYRISTLSGDRVGNSEVPSESSVSFNPAFGNENRYRFICGVKLVQEEVKVQFNDGMGNVTEQIVKSHLMTSQESNDIHPAYWTNGIVVMPNTAAPATANAAADTVMQPADPVREGYVFDGWYTNNGAKDGNWGQRFDFDANDGTVDQNTVLFAKWNEDSGEVDGDAGDGGVFGGDVLGGDDSGERPDKDASVEIEPSGEDAGFDAAAASKDGGANSGSVAQASGDGVAKELPQTGDPAFAAVLLCVSGIVMALACARLGARRASA